MMRPLTLRLARFATAGAVAAFAASLAAFHPDAATAAESRFLALVAGLLLGALAFGSRATPAVVTGGTLVAAALCMPAAEGTRGALVGLLLVGAVTWATWRTLTLGGRIGLLDACSLSLAWQVLLRSERLLEPVWTLRTAIWLLALPLAAALALWWYGRQREGAAGFILLAALAALGPGWGVVAVAALLTVAALAAESPSATARAAAALACAAAIWWQPTAAVALLVLVAALSLRRHAALNWLPALGALIWVALGVHSAPPLGALPWLLASLPLAVLAPPSARPLLAAALALALGPPPAAAPALALAVCALPPQEGWRRGQASWSLGLLAAIALAAAYPWLRPDPVALSAADPLRGLALATLAVLTTVLITLARRSGARLATSSSFLVVGAILVGSALLTQPRKLAPEPFVLTADQPSWTRAQPARHATRLILDSFVSGGGGLGLDRLVAHVRLTDADGNERRLEVLYGRQTADWATRRLLGPTAPPRPWLSWFSADGGLAQRYRASWPLDAGFDAREIEIARPDNLPPGVEVAILSVTMR